MTSAYRLLRLAAVVMAAVLTVMGSDMFIGRDAAADTEVVVFAAASTTNAITDIAEMYAARKMGRITPSFASSSTLAKQIEGGAPADVFLSANQRWMDYLAEKNLIDKESRFDLLSNKIVLIAPVDSGLKQMDVGPGFSPAKALGKNGRLAIGDPDHVPAGTYGKQALENLGGWEAVKDRLAPMKDVRAALVMVERGEAPLGLVYASDAKISSKVRIVATFPAEVHPPIAYPAAAVAGGKVADARKFLDFLKTPEARAVFEKYGFEVQ